MLQQCSLIFLECRRIGFFSAIRCRRIGHLFAIKFHQNICVDWSTSTNWDVYESAQMLCRFVDIDESGCLRIGTNVVSICRHRRIGMSTNVAICESICYPFGRQIFITNRTLPLGAWQTPRWSRSLKCTMQAGICEWLFHDFVSTIPWTDVVRRVTMHRVSVTNYDCC